MRYLLLLTTLPLLLSGCYTQVVKEDNAETFPTWELCTLLHRPNQMYSDWVSDEDELKSIENELKRRGITDKQSCEVIELAKRQCLEFGHRKGTSGFVGCTEREFKNINDKVAEKGLNRDRKDTEAAQSFINGWNSGLNLYQPPVVKPQCTTSVLTGQVTCY